MPSSSSSADFLANDQLLQNLLAGAVSAAKQAGSLCMECITKRRFSAESTESASSASSSFLATETKSNNVDFVTRYDKKCDEIIIAALTTASQKNGLEPKFKTEETAPDEKISNAPTWIVDPIDGTTSFLHMSFDFCISIALTVDKKPVIGVILVPLLNELFTAVKGRGAFCNGEPIIPPSMSSPVRPQKLSQCMVGYHLPADRRAPKVDISLGIIRHLLEKEQVHSVRCYGSAALDCAAVAAGRLDCYCELGINSWDVAAGVLLLQESGCWVGNLDGNKTNSELTEMESTRMGIVAACSEAVGKRMQEIALQFGLTKENYLPSKL